MEKMKTPLFYAPLIIVFLSIGCKQKAKPLAQFFKGTQYNVIYPVDDGPVPGDIYEETEDIGLGRPLAYKETCAKDLEPKPGKIDFGTYSATSKIGVNFLLGVSRLPKEVKVELEGAFEKEVSYTVTSEPFDTLGCDLATLRRYVREKMPSGDCRDMLHEANAVMLSKVAIVKKFTFKFKGLKNGGIDGIASILPANGGLKASKIDKETIELKYDRPMKLCYQRFTSEELKKPLAEEVKFAPKGIEPAPTDVEPPLKKMKSAAKEHKTSVEPALGIPKIASPGEAPVSTKRESRPEKHDLKEIKPSARSIPEAASPWEAPISAERELASPIALEPVPQLNAFTKEFFGIKE